MGRIAIFASYDKQGIVHDYVITYLKKLKQVADKIIFIADNDVKDLEKNKIAQIADYAQFFHHGEYDFGSYKRGYLYAKKHGLLEEANELIFCNDSCFCVSSLQPVFKVMDEKKCDFWGITKSYEKQKHLQSYFMVFKSNVFNSKSFIDHISGVTHQNNFMDIVNLYELPFTHKLNQASFIESEFICLGNEKNPTYYPQKTLEIGSPLIKRKVFTVRGCAKENVRSLLKLLNIRYRLSYKEICRYYKTSWSMLFPLIIPLDVEKLKSLFYQRKINKNGKICVKICKIQLPQKIIQMCIKEQLSEKIH